MADVNDDFQSLYVDYGSEFNVAVAPHKRQLMINGVAYSWEVFEFLANPDPTKLYSFERQDETVIVTTH